MTRIFSRRNRIFSRFSGSSLALFSSITWPATENSLSQSVEVGGGFRYCLASLQRARETLHSLPFSSKIFHQARQLFSSLALRNLFRMSSSVSLTVPSSVLLSSPCLLCFPDGPFLCTPQLSMSAVLSRPSPPPPLTRLQPSAQCRAESHPGHLPVHQKVAAIRFYD